MSYRVEFHPRAAKELISLDTQVQPRIVAALEQLSEDPFRHGSIQMKGEQARRFRVGEYRIIYDVDTTEKLPIVYRVRHRSEAYR
ncbi:type II toxin-antitoxin system RelE/ParE family toxin [uncultured Meiothermus sp.]|jgi:mRNA interferase RelE/StbE|uniref:type II toxin-antitoxin system RelE family toxin n=1 Tax=uncultured Meiothermus sp. TaxID=157471 RepID=UPI002609F54C|nr:type II toxin-antitoxin system RelE/ParE family toxin [uncultured Meiothermus sp.]